MIYLRFWLVGILLFSNGSVFAQNEEAIEDRNLARLDQVNDLLQTELTNKDRASFLFEKSTLMFETFGELHLRTATESLLEAIRLEPDKKYKDYLNRVYIHFWENKDLSGDDQLSIDLRSIRAEIQAVINEKI